MLKRQKRRYLALKIDSTETFDQREFTDAVWASITRLYGEYGASQTNLAMIDFDIEKKLAVIRVANAALDTVRASVASITKIGDKLVAVHVLSISGTLRALNRKLKE